MAPASFERTIKEYVIKDELMKNEEDIFDELLRSKLSDREFFFDELNWQKAEAVLKRREQLRNLKRYSAIFLAGLLLGGAIVYPLAGRLQKNTPDASPVKTGGVPLADAANKAVAALQTEGKIPAADANEENTKDHNQPIKGLIPKTNSNTGGASLTRERTVAHNRNTRGNIVQNTSTHEHGASLVASPVQNHSDEGTQTKAGMAVSQNDFNKAVSDGNNIAPAAAHVANNPAPVQASANSVLQNGAAQQGSSSNKISSLQVNSGTNHTPSPDKSANSLLNSAPKVADNATKSDSSTHNGTPAQPNILTGKTANNTVSADTGKKPAAQTAGPVKDFMTQTQDDYAHVHHARNIFSIEGGAGYGIGWQEPATNTGSLSSQNNGTRAGNGFSPVAGVRLTHLLNSKFALSTGVRFYTITNLNATLQNSNTSYDFGLNSTLTAVTVNTLYYASIPAELQYNFGNQDNILCLGASALYLLNSSSTVTTTTIDGVNTPASTNRTAAGYMDGFNPWDIQIQIAYRRRIYAGLYAGVEGYFGLFEVENSSFFDPVASSRSYSRNSGIRVILSYNINQ